jgi:hypothetical protein
MNEGAAVWVGIGGKTGGSAVKGKKEHGFDARVWAKDWTLRAVILGLFSLSIGFWAWVVVAAVGW